MKRRFRTVHRASAVIVAAFTVLHLANHLALFGGVDLHIRVMGALRLIYRHPVAETVLIAAILLQVASGITGLGNAWQRGGLARWQAVSGAWLALFLIGHTGAVIVGRALWGLDTNVYFGSAPLRTGWLPVLFVPYYSAAVIAVGAHLAAALAWRAGRERRTLAFGAGVAVAVLAAAAIVAVFAGLVVPFPLPAAYAERFAWAS